MAGDNAAAGALADDVDALAGLLPCDHVLWGELDLQDMTPVASVTSDGSRSTWRRSRVTRPSIRSSPTTRTTGDAGPLRLSDFAGPRALHRLGVYADFYRPLGVEHALCVALAAAGATTVGIAMHRDGTGFDDGDRALLARAAPRARLRRARGPRGAGRSPP